MLKPSNARVARCFACSLILYSGMPCPSIVNCNAVAKAQLF